MKTYTVTAQYVTCVHTEIEAESYEQAWEIAGELDGGTFTDAGFGDWDITSVEEVRRTK